MQLRLLARPFHNEWRRHLELNCTAGIPTRRIRDRGRPRTLLRKPDYEARVYNGARFINLQQTFTDYCEGYVAETQNEVIPGCPKEAGPSSREGDEERSRTVLELPRRVGHSPYERQDLYRM